MSHSVSYSVGHSAYQATEAEVMKIISSFPAGLAAGSDGFQPHLLELMQSSDAGSTLLAANTSFVNMVFDGLCHDDFRPIIFGGRLIALHKKSGGIRPIAVGCTWRRLAAKCANAFACNKFVSLFSPRQVGVAVKGGCEAAVHAIRRYMENMSPDHDMAKLDFYKAFNCLDRGYMLDKIAAVIPEIHKFCCLSYS
jgi:Reverse transcriptase (RNA-dependent DNA polymerase)